MTACMLFSEEIKTALSIKKDNLYNSKVIDIIGVTIDKSKFISKLSNILSKIRILLNNKMLLVN